MKDKVISKIIETVKNYNKTESKGELLVLIKEYSKLGLYEEVSQYVSKFLAGGGDISDLSGISDSFPEEIRNLFNKVKGKIELDEEFDADSFLEMGELLWEIGSPDEARENYIKAFEYYNILGNVDSAREVLNTLKQRYPDDSEIADLSILDVKDQLINSLSNIESLPAQEEIELRYSLGKRMHESDLLGDAEDNYRRVIELDSEHKSRRYLVALLRDRMAFNEALKVAEFLEENEKLEEMYTIAMLLMDRGDKRKAGEILKVIHDIKPDYRDVEDYIEVSYEREERTPEEKVTMQEALESLKEDKVEVVKGEKKKIVFL